MSCFQNERRAKPKLAVSGTEACDELLKASAHIRLEIIAKKSLVHGIPTQVKEIQVSSTDEVVSMPEERGTLLS